MTKRAGKRKNRNGAGPNKPAPGPEGPIARDPVAELAKPDGLSLDESLRLELQALRNNWLMHDPQADQMRQALLAKILRLTISPEIGGDPNKNIKPDAQKLLEIFKTLSIVEQRQQRIELQRLAILARVTQKRPSNASGGVEGVSAVQTTNVSVSVTSGQEQPKKQPWEIAQELLRDGMIQRALIGEPLPEKETENVET